MPPTQPTSDQLRPWQFFTLGALVCATAAVFVIRGTSAANLIFVCLAIFSAALVGLAALNALRPLATGETREPEMVGSHTRVALEREKNLLLRSIKELEFDRAMGKVTEVDYEEMVARLRSRAVRLMQQLDNTASGYRELIERELASRLVKAGAGGGSTKVEPYNSRIESHDSTIEPHNSTIPRDDSTVESHSSTIESHDSAIRSHSSAIKSGDGTIESYDKDETAGGDVDVPVDVDVPGDVDVPVNVDVPVGRDFSRAAGVCPSCATANDDDARFCKSCGSRLLAMLLACLFPFYFSLFTFLAPASAQLQMPDPKQMSGIPRPVTDLPSGHVSVRLIRGQLSNNIQGHPVEMQGGGKVLTVKTDENGRAEFSGVAAGTPVKAVTTVDGERLESQEFPWPGDGGIRLMLVATLKGSGAPPPVFQPQPGNVVFGDQTRVIIDHADDGLQVYYILDIQNSARTPVNPPSAVVINMPAGAVSPTVLSGAPQAVALGDHVAITGPFASGQTAVQLAFRLPVASGDLTFEQRFPLAVPGLAVLMKKVGETSLTSPQLPNVQERDFEGERYVLAQGPALAAGSPLAVTVSGLPHHSPWPRRIALGLAFVMLGGGFWAAGRRPLPGSSAARLKQLTGKREKIYSELVRLEQQRRAGTIDAAKYAERRPALLAQLERVYRDLDAEGGQSAVA